MQILYNKLRISLHIPPVQRKKQSRTHLLILPQLLPATKQYNSYETMSYVIVKIYFISLLLYKTFIIVQSSNAMIHYQKVNLVLTVDGGNIPN